MMKKATDAVRFITAVLLGISASITLAYTVRTYARDIERANDPNVKISELFATRGEARK